MELYHILLYKYADVYPILCVIVFMHNHFISHCTINMNQMTTCNCVIIGFNLDYVTMTHKTWLITPT
jgi:hypothetical protein